jgi:hypothetical protein
MNASASDSSALVALVAADIGAEVLARTPLLVEREVLLLVALDALLDSPA